MAISILGSKMGPGMARMDWLGKNMLKLVGICENLGVEISLHRDSKPEMQAL